MVFGGKSFTRVVLATTLLGAGMVTPRVQAQEVVITCLSFPKRTPASIELLVGPGKTVPINLQSHTLTDPLKVPRLAVWKFGKSGTNAAGEFRFKSYGQVRPGTARKQLLLFVHKGASPSDGLNILALNDDKTAFGASQMLFVNLAREPVAGLVGGKQFRLDSGKHIIIKPKADRGKNLCFASLKYLRANKWRTFFSTNWPTLTTARGLVFLYNDPGSRSVKIHSVVDSLVRVPPPGE